MKYPDLSLYPNFILIAGTGRNVGKTTLACRIIQQLSQQINIIALKITNHFHPVEDQVIISENDHFRIVEESLDSDKDSSRMKKAGAQHSYYIQCERGYLLDALDHLPFDLNLTAVVCESGGLHHVIKPGLFFLLEGNHIPENKNAAYRFDPICVQHNNGQFNFNLFDIDYSHQGFTYRDGSLA
jgi:hypothetical protein